MHFPEEFLHYVWQFRLYDINDLYTTTGEPVQVLQTGHLNHHAGPDFSNSKLNIGETTWVGNIEIHLKSSDWLKHNHQKDAAYDNVILHVVYENDISVYRVDGTLLPALELKERISESLINRYAGLRHSLNDFPCKNQIAGVDEFIVNSFLSRNAVDRLEQKSSAVYETLNSLQGDWDETFYRFLAKNFGFKVNAVPFEMLAGIIPFNIYAKCKDKPLQIEALVFGGAGFLEGPSEDGYLEELRSEFDFLKRKYNIKPVDASVWKFLRLRPQNFPTLRLAQFAALIIKSNHLFSKIMEIRDINSLHQLFEDLPVNPYWTKHFHFRKKSDFVNVRIGKDSVNGLLINTVSLFLFAYGKYIGNSDYANRGIKLLESLPGEKNRIVEKYKQAGVKLGTAFASQGVLQLKKQYCDEKRCLDCGIGIKILKQT